MQCLAPIIWMFLANPPHGFTKTLVPEEERGAFSAVIEQCQKSCVADLNEQCVGAVIWMPQRDEVYCECGQPQEARNDAGRIQTTDGTSAN